MRELKNAIQRALLLAKGDTIEPRDLELMTVEAPQPSAGQANLSAQERSSIIGALKKAKGNHSRASRLLGIARTTLASKLRRYKLDPGEWD